VGGRERGLSGGTDGAHQGSSEHLTFAAYLSRALLSFASCYCAAMSQLPPPGMVRSSLARWHSINGWHSDPTYAIRPLLDV